METKLLELFCKVCPATIKVTLTKSEEEGSFYEVIQKAREQAFVCTKCNTTFGSETYLMEITDFVMLWSENRYDVELQDDNRSTQRRSKHKQNTFRRVKAI